MKKRETMTSLFGPLGLLLVALGQTAAGAGDPADRPQAKPDEIERLLAADDLVARGATRVYRNEFLAAISFPVGGIGAGCIQFNGQARRHSWQIFNNFEAAEVPNSFLAVRAQVPDGRPVIRALQTEAVGPFAAMASLRFRGEYPLAWYDFDDPQLPVQVSMEVFNPLIPLREKDSAIPCALWNLTATNTSDRPVTVSFLATQENATGFGDKSQPPPGPPSAGGRQNRVLRQPGATILHLTTDRASRAGGYGDMALVAFEEDAQAAASWENLDGLWNPWSAGGSLRAGDHAATTSAEQTLDGALATPFVLQPGQQRTVRFALTWYFPNARHGRGPWVGEGNYYTTWWTDARDVAGYLRTNLDELSRLTRLYHDTFYASNLPYWLLDRIGSQAAVLRSKTCFWTKDGYFGGWEGCRPKDGSWPGNCTHVWHYAQTPGRLFPAIARRMREQSLGYEDPEGGIPHRHPGPRQAACDGQCGEILAAYREHLMSADRRWLDEHWPRIRKAMDYAVRQWDADEDGVLSGPQWNTLDGNLSGSSSWLGSLYLAALAATEKMALLEGDSAAAARYLRIRRAGAPAQDRTLFNGEYYIQIPGSTPGKDYGDGCATDQVLGQWWAAQVGVEPPYPPDRVRSAMRSVLKYNFHANFRGVEQKPRNYVDVNDAGMQTVTWPRGGQPQAYVNHAGSVFSGLEYAAAATMVQAGMLREGFVVAKAVADRYNGRLRTGLTDTAWGYSGNPFGDDEAGKFYARAMSSWSLLLACQGFLYDGPAGTIGFAPAWRPEDHASFFTAAEGWGLFRQKRAAAVQQEMLELRYGRLRLGTLVFRLPAKRQTAGVSVTLGGKPLAAAAGAGDDIRVTLERPVVLQAKDELQVRIDLQPSAGIALPESPK